jgi:hypothetical protein
VRSHDEQGYRGIVIDVLTRSLAAEDLGQAIAKAEASGAEGPRRRCRARRAHRRRLGVNLPSAHAAQSAGNLELAGLGRVTFTFKPVSLRTSLRFAGKVIFGRRDRPANWARNRKCSVTETQRPRRTPAKRGQLGAIGAASGKSLRGWSDWWSNEDSNQGPGRFYRRRATGWLRDRGRSDTNTAYIKRGSPWENGYIESGAVACLAGV